MPTPQGIQTVTLHGRYVEPDLLGTPLVGSVIFTPNVPMVTFPNENTLMSGTETATLDGNGEFTIDLPCTDTPGQNPDGWTYTVTEKLIGVRGRTFQIALPFTLAVVQLADISPSDDAPTWLPVTGPQGPPGLVNSVNGISLPDILLTAEDLQAVPLSSLGVPNGVATLDGTGKLESAQMPDLSTGYVTVSSIGQASGVAGLGADSKVPSAQLDLATAAPAAIAGVGAVGTSTKLARENHTHAGVSLTGAQSIAGQKTFTELTTFSGGTLFHTAAPLFQGATSSTVAVRVEVPGDTTDRFRVNADGTLAWGPGNAARDVSVYRSASGVVNSTGQFASDTAAPSAASHLTRKDYVDGLINTTVKLTGNQNVAGEKTFTDLVRNTRPTASDSAFETRVVGQTHAPWHVKSNGEMWFGPGNGVADTNLFRDGSSILATNGNFRSWQPLSTAISLSLRVTGDTQSRFYITADGAMHWGPGGSTGTDVRLYRNAAGSLRTDETFSSKIDQVTTGLTAASGFTVTDFYGRKTGGVVVLDMYLNRTGTAITAGSGNITDTAICTVPAGWRPTHTTINGSWDDGSASGGFVVGTDGLCTLRTATGNIDNNRNLRLQAVFIP